MTNPGAGLVRLVRAGVLTALVVALTTLAHRLGGAVAPGFFPIAVLTALLWPVAVLVTRRRLGPVALLTGLGAGQLLGHGLLGWLGSGPTGLATSVSVECLQHATHVGASTAACATDTVAGAAAHSHGQAGTALPMLVAHLVATLLLSMLVARGERVLWRVLDLVLRALAVLITPIAARAPRAAAPLFLPSRLDLAVLAGRGPPAYAA
jgi:hypothetical protein